jgi:phage gp36-like protein
MSVSLPALCTRARLEQRMSVLGVDLRTDDDPDALTATMNDAWVEVLGYVSNLYSDAQLGASEWVVLRWVDICTMYLCERRLNSAPHSAQRRYDKAIKDLEAAGMGVLHIPGAATRKALAPTLSNQRVKLWPHPHIVTTPHNSTGNPDGYTQPVDPQDYEPEP